ncbi:MAG: hypothetical protein EOO61_15920, partial [Hymenobacter sp.]
VNQFVLHSYVHQPTEAKPGITLGRFGLSFNRHNTWWPQASAYFEEQARAQYLLQKGKTVSDVLVYLGDKLPVQESADKTAMLLPDVRFNYCNAEVLNNRISVKDGKLMLDNETAFQFLLVPDSLLDLTTVQKIESLVQQGTTVVVPRPVATLSLKNYDSNNALLQKITASLWGKINGKTITENRYGKGKIIWGRPVSQIIKENNFIPDLQVKGGKMEDLMYIHKKVDDTDIYYVVNRSNNQPAQLEASFRVRDKTPSLWNPVDGTTYQLALYAESNGVTTLPLSLRPRQSLFIVFQKGTSRQHFIKLQDAAGNSLFPATSAVPSAVPKVYFNTTATNFEMTSATGGQYSLTSNTGAITKAALQDAKKMVISEIKGTVTLLNEPQLGPIAIQNFQSLTRFDNPLVKYYSGTAVYQMELNIPPDFIGGNTVLMQLDQFGSTAQVEWNGSEAGIVWEPGYQLDIT